MPFENEFASYEPLRRLLESPTVQAFQTRLKPLKKRTDEQKKEDERLFLNTLISKDSLEKTNWVPDKVIGIDGSYHAKPIENGFPGAEFGYVTIASVIILLNKVRELADEEFIDPKKFRDTEKAATIDCVFPGCNVILDNDSSAKESLRKAIYETLGSSRVFTEGETLLDTYHALLEIKISNGIEREPKCPIDSCPKSKRYKANIGVYQCECGDKKIYSTDALRLHELMNPAGTNGELYGQIMSVLERLWLIHILRAFEKRNWLGTLRSIAFVMDGLLAVSSTPAWLHKPITKELQRINELQKKINGMDLLILSIEKSGMFVEHFENIDTKLDGSEGRIPNGNAFLLSDSYIKKNIIFSETNPDYYGADTYFGRKFFYKTQFGYRLVVHVPFYNETQHDLKTAEPKNFPRLYDTMNLLDQLISNRYPNSVTPLISAHAEASIPLNLGKRIFEEIAKEIRERT